eukprot:COSAG01_NODE_7737_length_3079_cov_2.034564_5_plen_33_part_00
MLGWGDAAEQVRVDARQWRAIRSGGEGEGLLR